MKIDKYNVPNELIEQYCRIVMSLEKTYTPEKEKIRSDIHNKIFDSVGCFKSLWRRTDREFNIALNKVLLDLTYIE